MPTPTAKVLEAMVRLEEDHQGGILGSLGEFEPPSEPTEREWRLLQALTEVRSRFDALNGINRQAPEYPNAAERYNSLIRRLIDKRPELLPLMPGAANHAYFV